MWRGGAEASGVARNDGGGDGYCFDGWGEESSTGEEPQWRPCDWTKSGAKGTRVETRQRELIRSVLAVLHLDNEYILERVWENFGRVYADRDARPGFRKSDFKERVAAAFCINNVLAREGMPRPARYVTELCGLDSARPLLDLTKSLNFDHEERLTLSREDYELASAPPQEYVDTLCAHLGIPFHVATQIRERVEQLEWQCYGQQPTVLVAAAMQMVLAQLGGNNGGGGGGNGDDGARRDEEICVQLGCSQKTVSQTLRRIV